MFCCWRGYICEGSVTNRDTCSRKSKGCPPRSSLSSQAVFSSEAGRGSMLSNLGVIYVFRFEDTGQTSRFNAIRSSIYLYCNWCAVSFLVCFVHAWRGTYGFLHPQNTIRCQLKRSMDIKSHFRETRIPVEPTLTIIYFARFDERWPYNDLPIELWTRNVLYSMSHTVPIYQLILKSLFFVSLRWRSLNHPLKRSQRIARYIIMIINVIYLYVLNIYLYTSISSVSFPTGPHETMASASQVRVALGALGSGCALTFVATTLLASPPKPKPCPSEKARKDWRDHVHGTHFFKGGIKLDATKSMVKLCMPKIFLLLVHCLGSLGFGNRMTPWPWRRPSMSWLRNGMFWSVRMSLWLASADTAENWSKGPRGKCWKWPWVVAVTSRITTVGKSLVSPRWI